MVKELYNNESLISIPNGKVLLDFHATWCGPCKMLSIVIDRIMNENVIDIVKVDVDKEPELTSKFNIYSVPTLILLDNNNEIKRISGYMTEDELRRWISNE